MKYEIKTKNGRSCEIYEVRGIQKLYEKLGQLRGAGVKVTKINRVVVR